jgi:uncharacterized protein
MQKAESGWQPVPPAERYAHIDIIRGLALGGVLLVNALTVFRLPLLEHILGAGGGQATLDSVVSRVVEAAVEFKALTIFSFLFGAGMAIQTERAGSGQGGVARLLARRLMWLLVFGAVHILLIFNGDILALYAVCGLLLLPLLRLPWQALFVLGAALIALPEIVPLPGRLPAENAAAAHIARAREIYGRHGFAEIVLFRWHETGTLILPLLAGILPRTAGLMLWGMAAWRCGVLPRPGMHKRKLALALACAAAAFAAGAHTPIVLAVAYVSALLLVLPALRTGRLPGIAAAGQMSLTNYLTQSVVLGFTFYGYGFGLFGRAGAASTASLAMLLYVLQVRASRLWLRHFRFGPMEWIWRSLTYRRRQPMRRVPAPS